MLDERVEKIYDKFLDKISELKDDYNTMLYVNKLYEKHGEESLSCFLDNLASYQRKKEDMRWKK